MTINKEDGSYVASCDFCSNTGDWESSFEGAIEWKKENWASFNYKGDWYDICDSCIETLKEKK